MKTHLYSVGEIFRGKLLKNIHGVPYGNKSQVSKAVNRLQFKVIDTPWGPGKAVTMAQINKHNAKSKSHVPASD